MCQTFKFHQFFTKLNTFNQLVLNCHLLTWTIPLITWGHISQIMSTSLNLGLVLLASFSMLTYNLITSVNVFALPPDPNYNTSGTCDAATSNGELTKKTCCWSERLPSKLPPNNKANFCQTCTYDRAGGTYNCNEPQQQLARSPNGISPKDNVLQEP